MGGKRVTSFAGADHKKTASATNRCGAVGRLMDFQATLAQVFQACDVHILFFGGYS